MEITTNYLLWMNLCFALVALVHRNNTSELYKGKVEDQKPEENVLILERNKRLKEERFSILNGLLSKWKDCLLYQESCTEQGGYEKCDPDLVVVAMAACFSEYEDCDSYLTCSGEVEKTCLFDKEQLRVCEYIHGCSQCNSSSNRECSPRFAITLKWAMLEEKKKILLAKYDKGTSECRGVKTGLYWMMPQLMNNRRNTDHSETYDQRSTVNENEAGFFNFIVVAVDNRIALWKFDSQERKGNYIKPDDNILLNVNEIRATAKSQSEYGLARLIVLDECHNIHVICQLVTPSSFKPHLQSRQRKIFYEAHKETEFCVKDNLFLELVDGGPLKFSSVKMSDFENKMMTTPDKTSESSFETVKLNSLENFWLELGNIDQKGNSSRIPGIFIIQTRKGERSEWESLRPEGNQTFYFDTPIWFNPTIGYSGEFQVSVILKTYDFFGSSVVVDTSHLHFMMKVNYAPSARRNPHFDQLPTLTVNETDQGRPVAEYTDPLYEHSTLRSLGMIVFHAHSSHLGEWEARIHKKGGQWEPLFHQTSLKVVRYDMKMISGEDFCTLNNLHKTTEFSNVHSFVLLSATDHIRFRANSSWLWWNKWEAMKYTLLIYSAWNMSDSGISTKWPCSPHPSVAQNLSLFSLEYKDCSGRKITHKPILVDSCGEFGGDGTSCRLSNDSGKDCLRCGMDTTGNVIQPDCAGSCEQSNVLVTLGKNKVCIRKQDEHTITLCDGSKNSSAVNNRCGHCVGGNTNRSLNYDIDICNVCGGKNECVGCDGIPFSGTTLNEYGQCQNQTELETINSFSFMKFYVKRGTYFLTTWKPNSFCYAFVSKRNMNQQIEIEFRVRNSGKTLYSFNSLLTKVTSFLLIRFVRTDVFSDCHPFPSDMYFWPSTNVTIECHIYNDSSKSEFLFVEKTFKFTQLDCRKNYVAKITPTTVYNNKSTELTAEVKNISSTSFKCAHVSRSLSFFISSENSALTEHSTVRCHFPQIFQCQDYKLLLLDESWTKDDEPHLDIIVGMWENTVQIFRVNAPAPSVLEAIISDGLQEIQIRFTIGIVVTKQCSAIFTSESLEQLGFSNSSCWNSFNILTFYLQSTVKLSLNMTLIFARHNGIRTFCPPNHIGDEIEGIVNIKLPQRKIKPTLFLQGPQQVCTGVFQLRVSPIIGGGAFGLKYSWSVTSSPAVNLSVFHDILYYKRNVVDIPVEMLQPEVQYVFSVFGENVLGVMSDIYYHTVVRKNLHQLAVSIAGLVEADPSQDNMYKAEIDQCDEDVFPISFYWHVNSSDFSLPTISSPFLRILRYDMKGNKFYELDVAVFDERKQILMGRSSIVIRTKEIQLVTSTRIKFLTIGYKQPFCLNGSYFDDPSKENTTMFYQWMCFLDNGLPCYITQEDGGILRLEQVIGDDVFSRELCIKDGLPQLQNYNFTLLVKKDTRSASSSIFVKVIDGDDIPPFTLLDIAYVNNLVDLDTDLKLYYLPDTDESKCSRRPGSGLDCIYFKKWKLTYSPDNYGNISRFKLLADELSTGDFGVLKYRGEGTLDIFYLFNLTSAAPPFIGILKVAPYEGFGLVTDFTLDASEGWLTNIDRYPLTYQFFYVIHGNSRYFPIEIDISFFSGLARNIILPCGTNQVIVKVCDVFGLCSNKAQRVNVLCKKPVTFQEISSFDKLLVFGHCHRAFSLIDNMKEVLTEMDELQLENTVMTQIEDCFLKNIKWYQNIYFNNSHQDEKEEERIQSLNVLPMDNFTKQEKVEMLVFKDAIFQSIKKMESEHNYEKGQQIAHIIPQKAIGLIEEAVHQLQWDLGDTHTGLENDGLRVTDKSDYMYENYHFYLLQLYSYLFESTIHYSRNAGNYLMSAVWKSTIEEYQTNKFREGVEYEIMWHFIASPELRNFDLPRANIISKGTCQALPLSTLDSFFHLQPERGKSSTDKQENVKFYWSGDTSYSLLVSMKVSTYPNDMICFSIRYFTLKAAMYFFPRSDSELVSEVVSVIPRYLGNKNIIWTEEFQMNISFPRKENLKNCKCSRWNGKVWEDYEIKVFPLIMGYVTCMITSLGFYGIFTHKKSSINKEFTQEDWNTLKHYNDTTPIRVQMTMFSLNGQMRKQQGFINHIHIQLAANIGVHARRIDNVRLLKNPMKLQFTILPVFDSLNLEASVVEAVRILSDLVNSETLNLTDVAGYTLQALPYSLVLIKNTKAQTISHVKKDGTFVALSCGCGGLVLLLICLFVVIKRYKRSKSKVVPATCPLTNEKENNGVHVD